MKYIILGQLGGIGGWQLYIDTRTTYLASKGVEVYLISISKEQEIKLSALVACNKLCIPEVHMPPASYTNRQKNKILNTIFNFIGDRRTDGIIVESTDMNLSMWGEKIAEHYGGKNYCYLLHSHFPKQTKDVQDFFYFKYERNELSGMSEHTLPELFSGSIHEGVVEPRNLAAITKNSISNGEELDNEYEYLIKKKKSGYYIIGYFGNIAKPHFLELCSFIEQYAKKNISTKFIFVSIGSSGGNAPEKRQMKISKNVSNCEVLNIPALYPVPQKIFQAMDICIGSWGCADSAYRAGALTIRLLDDVTIIPHGIMGVTISNYKDVRCAESLEQLIEKIQSGKYKNENINITREKYDYIPSHQIIDSEILREVKSKEYYNIDLINNISKRSKIEKVFNTIFGIKITQIFMDIARVFLAKYHTKMQRKETYAK